MKITTCILIIFLLLIFQNKLLSQNKISKEDSLFVQAIINKYKIIIDSNVYVNDNGLQLDINKKQVKKIAKIILYPIYGWFEIYKQKPFRMIKYNNLWIVTGHQHKKRKGGVFCFVINLENGSVVHLSHGK